MTAGALVVALTPDELEEQRVHKHTGSNGAAARLWGLPGRWSVWSQGIARGTRWLLPSDVAAREVVAAAKADGSSVWPIVVDYSAGAVLVETRYLRNVVR